MEKQQSQVVLFGAKVSAYSKRVELALKLKGVSYAYVDEDLSNKSELLLQYNPVHKKVPVLLHNGKAIVESLLILEYIDEFWSQSPKLLPQDPYQRAKARFWANFHDHKITPCYYPIVLTEGKEQETAMEAFCEQLSMLEQGIKKDFPEQVPFHGENLGYLDIVFGCHAGNHRAFEEAVGVTIDRNKHEAYLSWGDALKEYDLVKETLPLHDELVAELVARIKTVKAKH